METDSIKSLYDYIEKVNNIIIPREDIVSKSIKLFRGYANLDYDNTPSIARRIKKNIHNSPIIFENRIIQKAKLKMPELFVDDSFPIQTITKLQHYGLPTRLLDFTTNALVALYFACQSKIENKEIKDGRVLVYLEKEDAIVSSFSPFVNAIADMSYVSSNIISDLGDYIEYLETKNYWKFTQYELINIDRIKQRLDSLYISVKWSHLHGVLEPPSRTDSATVTEREPPAYICNIMTEAH